MQKEFFPENITEVFDFLKKRINPKKPFVEGQKTITYGMLAERTGKLTALFRSRGIKPGDRIIIASKDHPESCILLLSLLKNGITAVMLDPDTRQKRVNAILGRVKPAMIFADKEILELWRTGDEVPTVAIIEGVKTEGRLFNKLLGRGARMELNKGTYPSLLKDLPVEVAAKTGTAEIGLQNHFNVWSSVFAPYENPEIVLIVTVENVQGFGAVTLPVAHDVLGWYFKDDQK